jgi:hypothetical protein
VALVCSDVLLVASLLGLVSIPLPGPYTAVWALGVALFVMEIALALAYDGEDSLTNLGVLLLSYFTYCQLWIVVVGKALYLDVIRGEKQSWVKTVRFARPSRDEAGPNGP